MKKAPWLLLLPLALLLMLYFSQWWHVKCADHAVVVLYGFPLAYTANGHAELTFKELYLFECILDYSFYLGVLYLLYLGIKDKLNKFVVPKLLPVILWLTVAAHLGFYVFTTVIPGQLRVFGKIPYVISFTYEKGFAFGWQEHVPEQHE